MSMVVEGMFNLAIFAVGDEQFVCLDLRFPSIPNTTFYSVPRFNTVGGSINHFFSGLAKSFGPAKSMTVILNLTLADFRFFCSSSCRRC